jgi:RecA/RadA recombinase
MDSEFGTSLENFVSMGIDLNRVVHIPIKDIEELKIEAVKQLNALKRGDNVMFFVDSVGNLASRKEIEDAESGESKVDLTRAKEMKSVGRILTPLLNLTDIPMVVVNHVYKEIGGANPKYAKNVVSGGTGLYLSADWVWQIGKRQDKDGDDIVGNDFVIKIDKSRFVQEKSEFAVNVSYEDGISPYTGLFDLAIEIGTIIAPVKGYYNVVGWDTPNFRRSDKEFDSKFWSAVFERTDFKQKAESKYKLAIRKMIGEDVVEV